MSINPKDMVDYAESILKGASLEMEHRNVINRAYYGAFLTARADSGVNGNSEHLKVIDFYSSGKNAAVGNRLTVLRRMRVKADYKPGEDVTYHEAKKSCVLASKIIKDLVK